MRTEIVTKLAGGAVAAAMLLTGASLAFAQSTSTYNPSSQVVPSTPLPAASTGASATVVPATSSGTTTATPGVPNTGAGGDMAQNVAVLGVSAAIAALGGAYLVRRRFAM
jgi:hypothetical protein